MRLTRGTKIPRDDGKTIVEFVGHASTGTASASVARCKAPPGWSEPAQTPAFDEVVMVLSGTLTLKLATGDERIGRGQVGLVPRGQRVVYANTGRVPCEYFSVCAPAFLPELAGIETPPPERVLTEVAHPQGKRHGARLTADAARYLDALGLEDVELSLSLVGDTAIRRLNRTWRQKDAPTDVLSFPADPMPAGFPGPRLLGDVVISLDTAKRQARSHRRPLEEELSRYLAHGILHLLGHDHERSPAEARKMARLEEKLLGVRGMVGDSLVPEDAPDTAAKGRGTGGRTRRVKQTGR